ncbi:LysM domain-containing protein [Halobacillus dabanensis]|uniref:LysM domain-containing protein n=1 Tax=Halobacillus dabanensis TaxID=240302 RepID=A0A1I3RWG6_HALDA|nr:LysM domain-containing protein [Halobacillus dabanensis]SFJ49677.1 LysM domain-containing protein [Halobacillus dabanensis]
MKKSTKYLTPLIALGISFGVGSSVSAESDNTVEVKPDDTLWSISQLYEGVTVDELYEMNPNVDPFQLEIGSELRVKAEQDSSREIYHTVTPGSTLSSIANLHANVTLDELYELNPDIDPYDLQPGDKVKVRETGAAEEHISKDKAENLVRENYDIEDNVKVEYDNVVDNKYLIHAYNVVDNHTATVGWYLVNPHTGETTDYMK